MEEFDRELEECIARVKWDLMGREKEEKNAKDLGDIAIMAIVDEEQKIEFEEHEEMVEAKMRTVYDADEGTWSYSKKRVTDIKGNNMVILPGKCSNFQDEANLEMLRAEMRHCFKDYMKKNCNSKGDQESNLTKGEKLGLKSLQKRFIEEEIIILPTDKSGHFGVMNLDNYLRAGEKHTKKDEVVNMDVVIKTQNELNGYMSMKIKFFKIGNKWRHGDRVRSTTINHSLSVCQCISPSKTIKVGLVRITHPHPRDQLLEETLE